MAFDIERVKQQLKQDEGVVCEIYLDHLGYKTCGIGHLVLETDPEHELEVGADVNEERVNELFAQDLDIVLEDCKKAFDKWDDFNFVVQEVLVNMMFNLGMTRLLKFKKMHAAIEAKDWQEAGIQMKDSRWFTQVGPRAGRLIERIRTIDS